MALQNPRLAWTVMLAPKGSSLQAPPPWPAFVQERFGDVQLGPVEPVQQVLQGPLPNQALGRQDSGTTRWVLAGLGRAVAVTVVVSEAGAVDRKVPVEALRKKALTALMQCDDSSEDDLLAGLQELIAAEQDWDFLGLVEAVGSLSEGVAPELPDEDGWDNLDGLTLGRAAGVGPGHVAWELHGTFSGDTQRSVMDRRLQVLLEGHLSRTSALVCYGLAALEWGVVVRRATRRAAALEAVLDEVRLAASWAVSGGPAVELDHEAYLGLSVRLETLRVGLEEDAQQLRFLGPRLSAPVERVLGEGKVAHSRGALVEASPRAAELLCEFEGRLKMAARWGDALQLSEQLIRERS